MDLSSTDLKPESSTSPDSQAPPSRTLQPVRSVLLVGASVRSLAESAIACGLSPLCVDFFEDSDLTEQLSGGRGRFIAKMGSFENLPAITQFVHREIPVLWTGGLENHPDVLRELAQKRPLIGADPEICTKLRNPFLIAEWLKNSGIAAPGLSAEAVPGSMRRWLRKPVCSSGGLGISFHQSLPAETHEPPAGSGTHYFQEFMEGVPVSALLLSDGQTVRLAGMSLQLIGWKSLGASGFLFCGNVGPLEMTPSLREQILKTANVLVQQSSLRGVFGLDFVLRKGQLWLLEVNPRIPASHVVYESTTELSELSLIEQHLAAFGWQPSRPKQPFAQQRPSQLLSGQTVVPSTTERVRPFRAGCLQIRIILWTPRPIRIQTQPELVCSLPWRRCRIADVPTPGTDVIAGSPLCSIHASAESAVELRTLLRGITVKNIPQSEYSWSDISIQLENLFDHLEAEM